MKRVVRKVRSCKSDESREHLIFSSRRHGHDKAQADRLRATEFVAVHVDEGPSKEPFPKWELMEGYWTLDGSKLRSVKPDEYKKALADYGRKDSIYYVPTGRVRKTDARKLKSGQKELGKAGDQIMQPRKGSGYLDVSMNLSRWMAEEAASMVEAGDVAGARALVLSAIGAAKKSLEGRTGYRIIGVAVHPDSRDQLGLHLQYQTHWDGRLRGRSATGAKGRRGLRLAGDALSSVSRYAEFVEVDERTRGRYADKDDTEAYKAMEEAMRLKLGADRLESALARARDMAVRWKARRDSAIAFRRAELASKESKADVAFGQQALARFVETGAWPIAWHAMSWTIWKQIPRKLRPVVWEGRYGVTGPLGRDMALRAMEVIKEINQPQIKQPR